jgi:hypothetical protein
MYLCTTTLQGVIGAYEHCIPTSNSCHPISELVVGANCTRHVVYVLGLRNFPGPDTYTCYEIRHIRVANYKFTSP